MNPSRGLLLKTYLLIFVMILAGPIGNVLLSRGMKRIGPITGWTLPALFHVGTEVFSSGSIWLGIGSLITFFVAYMLVLSWADYSYVQPASSLAYGVVAVLGYFVLGESISPVRWLGIAIICLGVLVVGQTHPQTAEVAQAAASGEADAHPHQGELRG